MPYQCFIIYGLYGCLNSISEGKYDQADSHSKIISIEFSKIHERASVSK